jgi:hypothetical protein
MENIVILLTANALNKGRGVLEYHYMGNPQLLDYVTTQLRMGVSPDAIRSALLEAGWPELDVRDALGGGNESPAPVAEPMPPMQQQPVAAQPVAAMAERPTAVMGGVREPQASYPRQAQPMMARSDVMPPMQQQPQPQMRQQPMAQARTVPQTISFGDIRPQTSEPMFHSRAGAPASRADAIAPVQEIQQPMAQAQSPGPQGSAEAAQPAARKFKLPKISGGSGKKWLSWGAAGVLVIGLGAAAGLLYVQQSNLGTKLDALSTEKDRIAGQLETATRERDDARSQMVTLKEENDGLKQEAAAFEYSATKAVTPIEVSGTLRTLGNGLYAVLTAHNMLVVVENSKDPGVSDALQPYLDATVKLSGTHVGDGTGQITVRSVNGEPVNGTSTDAAEPASDTVDGAGP